ncbi:MAG: helix-turn-helix transcriptional regulator [Clostridia bacterium]|nr:helix-turn-helix transcriptional regulator [Clostridia bacterium]
MLIHDLRKIGNRLLALRKDRGLTQAELAERAGLADRTYADIERGTVNMRLLTLVSICETLHVRPDDLLLAEDAPMETDQNATIERLMNCSPSKREAMIRVLKTMLDEMNV